MTEIFFFFSVNPKKVLGGTFNKDMATSFHIVSSSLYSNHNSIIHRDGKRRY